MEKVIIKKLLYRIFALKQNMVNSFLEEWKNMTSHQKTYVKHNIFNISTLLAVLGFIIYQAKWQSTVDSHISNESIHMNFERRIQVFVPRVELDSRLKNIEKFQSETTQAQNKILELLMRK